MLTESFVSAIIQISITGAGLILAIYALVAPLSRKIFKERAKILKKKIQEFEDLRSHITPESSHKEIDKLKRLKKEIEEVKIFPRYLGIGVTVTFLSYMFSLIVASGWLANPLNQTPNNELLIIVLFTVSNVLFLFVGLFTIFEVFNVMKKEFEEIKKRQKEIKEIKET
jgi:hypothetical protein